MTWEFGIALLTAAVFLGLGNRGVFSNHPRVGDVVTGGIAYASIALGFCIAGLTISLTLPDAHFTRRLATTDIGPANAYSALLFVFSWTAVVHWCAVVVMFVVALSADSGLPLVPFGSSAIRLCVVSFTAGLYAYCLCQFLITIITLSQVGRVYIKFIKDQKSPQRQGE